MYAGVQHVVAAAVESFIAHPHRRGRVERGKRREPLDRGAGLDRAERGRAAVHGDRTAGRAARLVLVLVLFAEDPCEVPAHNWRDCDHHRQPQGRSGGTAGRGHPLRCCVLTCTVRRDLARAHAKGLRVLQSMYSLQYPLLDPLSTAWGISWGSRPAPGASPLREVSWGLVLVLGRWLYPGRNGVAVGACVMRPRPSVICVSARTKAAQRRYTSSRTGRRFVHTFCVNNRSVDSTTQYVRLAVVRRREGIHKNEVQRHRHRTCGVTGIVGTARVSH